MKMSASDFKARCLAVIDQVHERGQPVLITKRGRPVARLVPAGDVDERPWLRLRQAAEWRGDPLAPVVAESEVDALSSPSRKPRAARPPKSDPK
jgi:prevent-host-death family protein